jgi:hypothetical protein
MKRIILALLGALLAACGSEPTPAPPEAFITPTVEQLPTPTVEPTVTATPLPTEVPRDFTAYTHPTGVFTITLPQGWETLDASTNQRLRTRLLPPPGYGSRATVEVTNEGELGPDDIRAEFEQALRLYTVEQATGTYTQTGRASDETGTRYEAVFAYDDGKGGQGTERFIGQQSGPYFALTRIFLAEEDVFTLSSALETMATGLALNAQAGWGSAVAAINPAELPIVDALLWQDEEGITYWAGQVRNDSPAPVDNPQISVALCDDSEVVVAEVTEGMTISRIGQGAAIPFGLTFEELPDDVRVCQQSATGVPAQPDPTRTNALSLSTSVDRAAGLALLVEGNVTNNTLSPVTGIDLFIAVFDAEGAVVGHRVVSFGFETTLQPGQSQAFREPFEELGGEASTYIVYNEAVVLRETSPALQP